MLIFLGPISGTATIQTKSLMRFSKPYNFKTMLIFFENFGNGYDPDKVLNAFLKAIQF